MFFTQNRKIAMSNKKEIYDGNCPQSNSYCSHLVVLVGGSFLTFFDIGDIVILKFWVKNILLE